MFNGKIHYKWPFAIAMLNYQRVYFSEGASIFLNGCFGIIFRNILYDQSTTHGFPVELPWNPVLKWSSLQGILPKMAPQRSHEEWIRGHQWMSALLPLSTHKMIRRVCGIYPRHCTQCCCSYPHFGWFSPGFLRKPGPLMLFDDTVSNISVPEMVAARVYTKHI